MNLKNNISHVREIYRPFYGAFLVLMSISACSQTLSMAAPYFYGKIINGFIAEKPPSELIRFAIGMVSILFLKSAIEFIHGRQHVGKIAFDIEERIAEVTLNRVMKLSLGQILNHNSGFKQDVIKKGESAVIEMVELLIFDTVPVLIRIVVGTIALFVLNFYLGAITLTGIIAFITSSIIINKKILPQLRKDNKLGNKLGTNYWEIIKHLRLVITNGQEDRTVKEYVAEYRKYSNQGKKLWFRYFNMVTFFREPFSSLGQFAVLVAGIYLVHSKKVTPGNLVMAMAWSMSAFQALGNIGTMQRKIVRYSVSIGRYFTLLNIPPAISAAAKPIRIASSAVEIEFRDVSFEYPKFSGRKNDLGDEDEEKKPDLSRPVGQAIERVSFKIKSGTTCAFVGHSGAGKSTVINLLLRGYDPCSGQVLINGNDLRLIDLTEWRKKVGCVEQEPKLWDDTLRRNMLWCLDGQTAEVSDMDLDNLARRTRISEFYPRLGENPFETEIGENGVQLSGGQRQRVAIARTVAKSPSLLILDEATNALDAENEYYIQEAMRDALVGRTGIIIAHRLSTIRHANKIIVFENGRVVGDGNHEELMQSCEAYRSLVKREIKTLAA